MENLSHSSPDMRRSQRKAYNKLIFFSFNHEQTKSQKVFYARAIDISETGMGIETDYPLAPGHTLWLDDGSLKTGTVKWIIKHDTRYRAGIEIYTSYNESSLAISETIEKYRIRLDDATDEFIRQLEMIENRCLLSLKDERIIEDLDRIIDNMMSFCKEFEEKAGYTKDELKKIISRFHRDTNPILSKSYYINRARTWPQGYQGDYMTLEHIYRNTPYSEGIGYYLDLWALNTPLGHAVRNRIKKLEDILRREINRRYEPKILNIACGSCRELMGIANKIKERDARLICIDNDTDALNFAEIRLSSIGISDRIDFRKYNALRMFDNETTLMEFGRQDIIYSVGFFDYLPDEFLIKLLSSLYNLLDHGGILIAAFKDAARYRSQEYHWILNWDGFLQRREEDFRNILSLAGIPNSAIKKEREESGIIIFYTISKQ